MHIWTLTPADPSNSIWARWSPEPIIIRAESEREGTASGRIKNAQVLTRDTGCTDLAQSMGRS